jgi:hypothetical protein
MSGYVALFDFLALLSTSGTLDPRTVFCMQTRLVLATLPKVGTSHSLTLQASPAHIQPRRGALAPPKSAKAPRGQRARDPLETAGRRSLPACLPLCRCPALPVYLPQDC